MQKPANQKGAQNAAFEKRRNSRGQRPTRASRGGGGTAVLSGTHGRAYPSAPDLRFSFATFRLPARFFRFELIFLLIKGGCIWLEAV